MLRRKMLSKSGELDNKQRWYWNTIGCILSNPRFSKINSIVEKLIEFDANLKEDWYSLYMNTNQHAKAL